MQLFFPSLTAKKAELLIYSDDYTEETIAQFFWSENGEFSSENKLTADYVEDNVKFVLPDDAINNSTSYRLDITSTNENISISRIFLYGQDVSLADFANIVLYANQCTFDIVYGEDNNELLNISVEGDDPFLILDQEFGQWMNDRIKAIDHREAALIALFLYISVILVVLNTWKWTKIEKNVKRKSMGHYGQLLLSLFLRVFALNGGILQNLYMMLAAIGG